MNKNLICKNDIVDSVKNYTPNQIKLFYGMLYKFKESVNFQNIAADEEIEMYLYDLKKLVEDSNLTQSRISDVICEMPNEIKFIDKNRLIRMTVFEYIQYDFKEECLKFKVTESFSDVFLKILESYTIIQLQFITKLNSKYSQRLYELGRRYLKQENYLMKVEDFKVYFQVPKSYQFCNIDQKILNPAIKELNAKTNINCAIKKKKKGRNITHILFKFKKEV